MECSERLSYEQWQSLIEMLKGLPRFKVIVQSSPGDVMKFVYKITKESHPGSLEDSVTFIVTDAKVILDVQSPKDTLYRRFVEVLFEVPKIKIPLYINDNDGVVRAVVLWRLRNNV